MSWETTRIRILPDAATWRKYVRLIQTMVTDYGESLPFQWILTESAVELMDYRHQSVPEATSTPQERTLLQQLVQQQHRRLQSPLVLALADLSVRTPHDDEWDVMQMENMDVIERSRHAQMRAASLMHTWSTTTTTAAAKGTKATRSSYWLLVDNLDNVFALDDDDDDNAKYVTIQDILNHAATYLSSSDDVQRLQALCQASHDEYQTRNNALLMGLSSSSSSAGLDQPTLSEAEIQTGLTKGTLLRGRFHVSKENIREAYVTAGNETLFIDYQHWNRALHQDVVIVQPLPKAQWGCPMGRRRLVHPTTTESEGHDHSNNELHLSKHNRHTLPLVPSGRVVALAQAGRRIFVATMIDVPSNVDDSTVLVVPMDICIPKIRIKTRTWQRLVGQRLEVEILAWDVGSTYPSGHCRQVLGPIGDLEVEVQALLIENQVALTPFSAAALACLPIESTAWQVSESHVQHRLDLRTSRFIFSVDPPGCQDIDDTMHAEVLPNGDIESKLTCRALWV
jgi:exoribonuclease R